MPWLRVDDRMYCNQKTAGASHEAFRLWMWASDYSADQLTDGRLKEWQVVMLAGMIRLVDWRAVVDELLATRLFDRDGDDYLVHDYLKYNPSRETVLDERADTAERVRDYRERRRAEGTGQFSANGNTLCNPVTQAQVTPTPYPVPMLDKDSIAQSDVQIQGEVDRRPKRQKTEVSEGFNKFWEAYPRKIAKSVAVKAYSKCLLEGATPEMLQAGAVNYSQECIMTARERQFICFPSTFLNQRRFEDYREAPDPADYQPKIRPNGRRRDGPQPLSSEEAERAFPDYAR